MAVTSPIPVELYLHTAYEPDADFVDGEIEERPVGELDHANWQLALQLWFAQHGKQWGIRVFPEVRVQVNPTRYRVPDVVVVDQSLPTEQILTHPPIAVFEVLSQEDVVSRTLRKLADYTEMGIRNVFVVDPRTEAFYRDEQGALAPLRQTQEPLHGSQAFLDSHAVSQLRN